MGKVWAWYGQGSVASKVLELPPIRIHGADSGSPSLPYSAMEGSGGQCTLLHCPTVQLSAVEGSAAYCTAIQCNVGQCTALVRGKD